MDGSIVRAEPWQVLASDGGLELCGGKTLEFASTCGATPGAFDEPAAQYHVARRRVAPNCPGRS